MFTQNMSSILHFGVGVTRIDRFMIEVGLNLLHQPEYEKAKLSGYIAVLPDEVTILQSG
jgi:hypothetical protein